MDFIETETALEALYGTPVEASTVKVAHQMTPLYRQWIEASRFCVLTTVGPDGTDASPRGDTDPVVRELDPQTLAMPDWRGNDRLDSLRNIVLDGRVSLMFMISGSNTVIRLNGTAKLTQDEALRSDFARDGRLPRTVVVISIGEIYFQCARALLRSELWTAGDQSEGLPTAGDILREMTQNTFDGATYDANWPARAQKTMW
ncbi:MAG: pyridoxamine 5'-phosphate oxidase family protein [Pseudomonadota bacterium]